MLMAAQNCMAMMTTVIPVAALTDPVELRKTWMNAKPVWDSSTWSISPTQKARVMIMTKPVDPLRISVQIMPRGRTRDASRISSANSSHQMSIIYYHLWKVGIHLHMWTAESGPLNCTYRQQMTHFACLGILERTDQGINRSDQPNQTSQTVISPAASILDGSKDF